MRTIKDLHRAFNDGGSLTNKEVLLLMEHFKKTGECCAALGERFALATQESYRCYDRLCEMGYARGLKF